MGLSMGPNNKAAPSFRKRLRQYVEAGGGHFEHLLQLKKWSQLRCLSCPDREFMITDYLGTRRPTKDQ